MLRFHIPLIEPDVRISRIRLSEETSRFRPRKAARPLGKPDKTKRIVQGLRPEISGSSAPATLCLAHSH